MYRILTDDEVMEPVAALPVELFPYYAQVLDLLELSPWTGEPYHPGKPAAPMRRLPFGPGGRGEVIYLVLEDRQRVDLLRVYWL